MNLDDVVNSVDKLSKARVGAWKKVTIVKDANPATSVQIDLGAEFYMVQCYNPTIDSATITIQAAREDAMTPVQAYNIAGGEDKVNTTTARATAGMNVFNEICAQYVKVVLGAVQTTVTVNLYIRGIIQL